MLYYSSFIIVFIKKYCVRKKESMVGRKKKESIKIGDFFFALNFWLSLTSTLQQNRIPLSKILDPPLLVQQLLV